jgi:hypothetical protein
VLQPGGVEAGSGVSYVIGGNAPVAGSGVPPVPPQSGEAACVAHQDAGGDWTGQGEAGIQFGGA